MPEKTQLRAYFKKERNKLRDISLKNDGHWGRAHIENLVSFLKSTLPDLILEGEDWPSHWAAYFPMGSELNLLCHSSMNKCWLPHIAPDKQLKWFRWQDEVSRWNKDKFGLPVPPDSTHLCALGETAETPRIIVTPCLAVDHSGTRLGYGGGYYDRLLAQFHQHIFSVACVPAQLFLKEHTLPRMQHDMPVDMIVTETGITLLSEEKLRRVLKR